MSNKVKKATLVKFCFSSFFVRFFKNGKAMWHLIEMRIIMKL
jgi:hypothetical protein